MDSIVAKGKLSQRAFCTPPKLLIIRVRESPGKYDALWSALSSNPFRLEGLSLASQAFFQLPPKHFHAVRPVLL